MSQRDLASKLDMPESTVSTWTNMYDIPLKNIRLICEVFDIQLHEYFTDNRDIAGELKINSDWIPVFQSISKLPEEDRILLARMMQGLIPRLSRS